MCWLPLVAGCGKRINPSSSLHFRWQLNFNPWVWGLFFPQSFFSVLSALTTWKCFSESSFIQICRFGGDAGWMKDFWRQRQMTNNTWPISSRDFMEEQHPWAHLRQGKTTRTAKITCFYQSFRLIFCSWVILSLLIATTDLRCRCNNPAVVWKQHFQAYK